MGVISTVTVPDCECCQTNVPNGSGSFSCVQIQYDDDVGNTVINTYNGVCWGHLVSDISIDCPPFPYVYAETDRYEVNYTVHITNVTPGVTYRANVEITRCTENFWDPCAGQQHNFAECSVTNNVNLIYQTTDFVPSGNTYSYSELVPIVSGKYTGVTAVVSVVAI